VEQGELSCWFCGVTPTGVGKIFDGSGAPAHTFPLWPDDGEGHRHSTRAPSQRQLLQWAFERRAD
jgi:hypothetical protein